MFELIKRFIKSVYSDGLFATLPLVFHYIGIPDVSKPDKFYHRLYNAYLFRDSRLYTSCESYGKLPTTTNLPHPVGIIIGKKTKIGENVEIRQNVTLGSRGGNNPGGQPTVQDNVTIHTGAIVLGDITLHQGCVVGANSVVLDDVKEGKTVVGSPATEVSN